MNDRLPTARVHHAAYAGGKYGLQRVDTGRFVALKRPFGSVTAAHDWLERSGYSLLRYEVVKWERYAESEQYKEDRA